ncbi:MAG: ABC transporter ATP-binding protein [Clostridia bacterium]|nr:ABC transporter ATP-binding protein [Clostridia bacterium]
MKKPKFDPKVLRRLLQYVKPYRREAVFSLLCALFVSAAALVIPVLSGRAIDAMADPANMDPSRVHTCLLLILLCAGLSALCQQAMAVKNNRITCSVARDLREAVMAHIMRLPLSYLDAHPSGDLVSRMVSDVDTLSDGLLMGFTQLMTGIVTILGTLGIMLALDWRITLAVVVLTPFSLFTASFIARRTHRYFTAQAEVRGRETALINEMVEGQKVVRAFGYEKHALADFDAVNEELGRVTLKATFFSSLTNPSTRLVNNVIYAAVAFLAALLALEKSITVGEMSVFLSYASQYAKPFNEISGVVTELENATACAARVFELLDAESETPDPDHAPKTLSGLVELKDVSFRYEADRPLITHFSLRVEKGRRVAIVGPTGCGKTTLINLLMRFYDVNSGAIEVDGTDVRALSRHALRANYGMVLQETWLRSGTIRENIAYGRPEATDEEIIDAAKRAHCHGFIRRLPQGYDTVIGENGGMLSQGQKQLLCIARVMLITPSMLILDEATSSIDTRTEVLIQEAFSSLMRGRTSFIVAHRLSTIRDADVILVMESGHIVEQGDYETLMRHDGAYRRLYRSQFEGIAT